MQSQTGYGRAANSNALGTATVEIKSVNGKFLDVAVKGRVGQIEDFIKKSVANFTTRGTVEVKVFLDLKELNSTVNYQLAASEIRLAREMSKKAKVKQNIGVKELLQVPGVVVESQIAPDALWQLVGPALSLALTQFKEFKLREGRELLADLLGQASEMTAILNSVKVRVPNMLAENQEKMRERIKELLGDYTLDETKLANEIAFFVDKVDINEEIKRLESHLSQFNELIKKDVCGKQLEFLSQEMTREINTMGSKSNDIAITNFVLAMKNVNEKIKEQIRNVE